MSTLNHMAAIRQNCLAEPALCNQPELRSLLVALQSILSPTPAGELMTFKPARRAIRAKAAYGMTGDGRSHFWARQNPKDPAWDPTFPASFKLDDSPRSATVWFEDEIEAWLESRAHASRKPVGAVAKYGRWKRPSTRAEFDVGVAP